MHGDYGTGVAEGAQSEAGRWGFPFVTEVRSGPGAAGGLAAPSSELPQSALGAAGGSIGHVRREPEHLTPLQVRLKGEAREGRITRPLSELSLS